jgi:hypothetical protein
MWCWRRIASASVERGQKAVMAAENVVAALEGSARPTW